MVRHLAGCTVMGLAEPRLLALVPLLHQLCLAEGGVEGTRPRVPCQAASRLQHRSPRVGGGSGTRPGTSGTRRDLGVLHSGLVLVLGLPVPASRWRGSSWPRLLLTVECPATHPRHTSGGRRHSPTVGEESASEQPAWRSMRASIFAVRHGL